MSLMNTINAASVSEVTISLLLQRFADNRPLHSFPTRRSSDLFFACKPAETTTDTSATTSTTTATTSTSWRWRSEEHTSELQSPCNLVCRLLLEKKKIADKLDDRQHSRYHSPVRMYGEVICARW